MKKAIKIKSNYVPKAQRIQATDGKQTHIISQKCPQCNQQIPINELEKHMKIELLDPKWKEQRDRENAKKRESSLNLDNGSDIAKYISDFASVRKDIFGGDTLEMKKKIEEQKKQAAKKETISWDGLATSINVTTRKAYSVTTTEELKKQVEDEKQKRFGPDLDDIPESKKHRVL